MTTLLNPPPSVLTLADLLHQLGDIPPNRVRVRPALGAATEADVVEIHRREKRLCELVDGVLVEKAMGYPESVLAIAIATALKNFVSPARLAIVSGEAGMMRLFAGLVRIPDVAFVSRERLPDGQIPTEPIPSLIPDLAVEVLSQGNTPAEMARKRREYFEAGVRLVWIVDHEARAVTVYTTPDAVRTLGQDQTLDGGVVLPGFRLELRTLFAELDG